MMRSPPTTFQDLDAGSVPYSRALPRRSKPHRIPAAAPGYHPSPLRPSSSAVPFCWEHRPGIPKSSAGGGTLPSRPTSASVLPLPPPLRSAPPASLKVKQRPIGAAHDDPFAAALAECAKAPPGPDIDQLFARRGSAAGRGRRPSAASWSISDRLGLFGLLHASSCKATCAVADSTVFVPSRPGSRTAS